MTFVNGAQHVVNVKYFEHTDVTKLNREDTWCLTEQASLNDLIFISSVAPQGGLNGYPCAGGPAHKRAQGMKPMPFNCGCGFGAHACVYSVPQENSAARVTDRSLELRPLIRCSIGICCLVSLLFLRIRQCESRAAQIATTLTLDLHAH